MTPTDIRPGPGGAPVGFGTWALGERDWGPLAAGPAKSMLRRAWERGFRHFDTAEAYGNGRAEQLVGQALRRELRQQRDAIQIASKSVVRPPDSLVRHLERSLRRLGTEYLDIFYIHWPREGIDLRAAVSALDHVRERGLIRGIGLCNVNVEQVHAAGREAPIAAVQFGYNLLWRHPERHGLTDLPVQTIAYSPLAQGLLARPFAAEPAWHPDDHRPRTPLFGSETWETVHAFNRRWVAVCAGAGVHPAAAALHWVTGRVSAAVVGGRSLEQVDRTADGLTALSTGTVARAADAVLATVQPESTALQRRLPDLPNLFGYVPTPCRGC